MNIIIDEKLVSTLETCALNDGVSNELWVERKINAILADAKLKNIVNTVRNDIEIYEPVILNKKAEIDLEKLAQAEANKVDKEIKE